MADKQLEIFPPEREAIMAAMHKLGEVLLEAAENDNFSRHARMQLLELVAEMERVAELL